MTSLRRWGIAVVVLGLAGATIGAVLLRGGSDDAAYRDVAPSTVAAVVDDADVWLVNVHTPYEGEIPGTDAFIPYTDIARSDDLPGDKDAEVIVYCRSGRMSAQAASSLVQLGYTNVLNMTGGFDRWENEGRELITRS